MLYHVEEGGCVTFKVIACDAQQALETVADYCRDLGQPSEDLIVEDLDPDKFISIRFEELDKPVTLTVKQWAAIYDGPPQIITCNMW